MYASWGGGVYFWVNSTVLGTIPANPSETVIRHIHEGRKNERERGKD